MNILDQLRYTERELEKAQNRLAEYRAATWGIIGGIALLLIYLLLGGSWGHW
jgi:hypothetical protein